MREILKQIFAQLEDCIEKENKERRASGSPLVQPCEIRILGQLSLLSNEKVAAVLDLQRTIDLDAIIVGQYFVKKTLQELLAQHGLVYDEDSEKIWLPPGSTFLELFNSGCVKAYLLDPESALVSKAIKAKEKNKQLIQDAIASEEFPSLADRIVAEGGHLEFFEED